MLNLKKVLGAKPKEHVEVELASLPTPWGEVLDVEHVLEEHPDPQFVRANWQVLNGRWRCAFAPGGHEPTDDLEAVVSSAAIPDPQAFDCEIVVPFSPESALSGVNRQLQPDELLWYRRPFEAPALDGASRLLLHFQAVDYACAVHVNGQLAGTHVGGYIPFAFDITDLLAEGANELAVCVADPSEFGGRIRGKQRFDRGDIWYTAQSGIWQPVWMEVVPADHIAHVRIEPDAETGILVVGARIEGALISGDEPQGAASGRSRENATDRENISQNEPQGVGSARFPESATDREDVAENESKVRVAAHRRILAEEDALFPKVRVNVFDADGELVATGEGAVENATAAVGMHVPNARLWSCEDPYLYRLQIAFGDDTVCSYCAFRTVEMGRDASGHPCVLLNGRPLFMKGVLDQAQPQIRH